MSMPRAFAEIGFTPSVLAIQEQQGSAKGYAKFLDPDAERGGQIGPDEAEFISRMDRFFQASVSGSGWPYVQFRGGPKGFIKVLDEKTIAYADFRGNRQYLSAGNITDDGRVSLILVDYPNRRRLKIWGRAELVQNQNDPDLIQKLHDATYRAQPERAVIITIEALDWNCPAHIPQRMTLEEMEPLLTTLRTENAQLKSQNAELQAWLGK
jgi:predicted pyridoxine 5'-phosphate oxidase superfamily flavin-nucleotide-binding protein